MEGEKAKGTNKDNVHTSYDTKNNQYTPLENEEQRRSKGKYPLTKRMKSGIWLILIVVIISYNLSGINDDTEINNSKEIKQAVKTHTSTTLTAGTKIMSADKKFAGKDYTVNFASSGGEVKMYVWDYAIEDGDYVEILVDGEPICKPFMLRNEAREFSVPSVCKVQIKGIKDGGKGITYGVYFDVNRKSYFNCTVVGGSNVYTLKGK